MRSSASAAATGSEQAIALAATRTIQADLASGLISDFWLAHPEHPVHFVHCESREGVAEAVALGRVDAGIADLPVDGSLVAVPFEHREVVLPRPSRTLTSPIRSPSSGWGSCRS